MSSRKVPFKLTFLGFQCESEENWRSGIGWVVFKLVITKELVPLLHLTGQKTSVLWLTFDTYPQQITELDPGDGKNVVFLIKEEIPPTRNRKRLLNTRKNLLQRLLESRELLMIPK